MATRRTDVDITPIAAQQAAVPDTHGINVYDADPRFRDLLSLYIDAPLLAHLEPHLQRMGALAGGELEAAARAADTHPPVLHHRTRAGDDRQWIEKHPAYRRLEEVAFAEYGLAAMSHRPGVLGWMERMPPAVKYALSYLFVQAEFGVCCPLSMTDSLTRTLMKFGDPALVSHFLAALTADDLDRIGQGAMFMTEQQAGSDVGGITTRAVRAFDVPPIGEATAWRLYGDKWFCSNADAAVAMVLARPDNGPPGLNGLTLFLLPRHLPDGRINHYRIVRLKEKLGTRGMPSGEIRLEGAVAWVVGDPARGFAQMSDMINMSRLSNGMRAGGMMRRALTEALFIARHRVAFGGRLIDKALMRRQLLKLMVPTEAARSVMLYTATQLAKADAGDEEARRRVRVLTPLIKFRACRDARRVTGDAMEVRGGSGYIEEWSDARLVRDSHLGSIWEGTSNIVALDVMRAIRREGALEALAPALDAMLAHLPVTPLRRSLRSAVHKAGAFAKRCADDGAEALARQAATGLYYAVAAVVLADEGTRLTAQGDARRILLAALTLTHRLSTRDPLEAADTGLEDRCGPLLLDEAPVPLSAVAAAVG